MLKGFLVNHSPAVKLTLLLALLLAFLLFSTLFGILALIPFFGPGIITALASPDYSNPAMINALKALQILNMAGGLLLPALLFVWLTDKKPSSYLKLSTIPAWLTLLLAAILIVAAQPFIGFTNELNSQLKLPAAFSGIESWMRNEENLAQRITEAFLSTTTLTGLAVNIFMIALLPAICEEILFRGVIAQLFTEWTRNIHWGIFISSVIFAAIHLEFYGFLPRFLLGMSFGYLFYWSGSLWLPVIAHLINNLLSVVVEFLFRKGTISMNADQFGAPNSLVAVLISFLVVGGIMYYFRPSGRKVTGTAG